MGESRHRLGGGWSEQERKAAFSLVPKKIRSRDTVPRKDDFFASRLERTELGIRPVVANANDGNLAKGETGSVSNRAIKMKTRAYPRCVDDLAETGHSPSIALRHSVDLVHDDANPFSASELGFTDKVVHRLVCDHIRDRGVEIGFVSRVACVELDRFVSKLCTHCRRGGRLPDAGRTRQQHGFDDRNLPGIPLSQPFAKSLIERKRVR